MIKILAPTIKIFQSFLTQHEKGVPMIDWCNDIQSGSFQQASYCLALSVALRA